MPGFFSSKRFPISITRGATVLEPVIDKRFPSALDTQGKKNINGIVMMAIL
jgi:hypothetical protein